MCMNYCSYIGALLVYAHMHLNLRGRLKALICLDHITLCIYLTDKFGGHETFGNTGGGAKEFIVVELYGNVTVIGCHHVTVVDPSADLTDLLF